MRENVDRMWAQIREYIGRMPRGRKIQMAILSVVVIALAITAVSLLTRTNWVTLPGTGDATRTAQIFAFLNEANLPARAVGNTIEVPEQRRDEIRFILREQGLMGLSDFDRSRYIPDASGFGVTSNLESWLFDAQDGADLATLIMQMPRIHHAMVILNSGESSPFRIAVNVRPATATVMLTLVGGGRLTPSEAQSIGEMVRTAIPGISYDNITITDSDGTWYRVGDASQDMEMEIGIRDALRIRLIEEMHAQVLHFLSPIYGIANLQIQPYVRLNFDTVLTERVEFFPPIPGEMEGIVRASEEVHELSRRWMDAEGIPGTDSNQMGSGVPEYPWGPLDDRDDFRRSAISKNFEINETRTLIEHERGTIEALSISVLINSEIEGVEGDFTVELTDLVSRAIGVSPGNIAIQYLPFTFPDTTMQDMLTAMQEAEAAARMQRMIDQIIMYAVILLLGLMLMLLVRAIVKAVKPIPEPEPILAAAGPEGIDYIVGDDEPEDREYEDVELQTKSAGLEQIERFIDKDSASVAQLLRNWLTDE